MRIALITFAVLFCFAPSSFSAELLPVAKLNGWEGPKPKKTPCKCRARNGSKVHLGAKMCMKRGDTLVTMQCRLVLNNTSWKKIEDGCDVAMN